MAGSGRKFGLAILGLGRMGIIHLKNLMTSPRARVTWVMRNDLVAGNKLAQDLDAPFQCVAPAEYQRILEDKSVDGVVVCSLTSQHEDQIKGALQAGKAVFSEKPITAEIESTRACYQLAEDVGKPLLCAFHRRFDPSFSVVKSSLVSKKAGNLRLLRSSSHDLNPPTALYAKHSGGIFKDSTIHDFDMALWLSGSPARKVYVQGQAFDPAIKQCGDLDLVVVSIEHANGTVSVIDNGRRCAHGYDQRLEAICDDGSYIVTNRPMTQLHQHTTAHTVSPGIDQMFDTRYTQAYENEMEHFLDVLDGVCPPAVTKTDTLSAMELAEAALQSARSGQPVHLS